MSFDLHTHTTASDGTLSASELVHLAKNKGLKGIAITDHDTVGGIEEALEAGAKLKITVLPGIEISCIYKGEEIHILGYLLDWKNKILLKKLLKLKMEREERARKIISRLMELGCYLDYDEIQQIAEGGVVGRPHIATALMDKGYVDSQEEAFNEFLEKGSKAYFPRKKLPLIAALALLKRAKAVSVLAHPGKINSDALIEPIISKGFEGIEVYHPSHNTGQIQSLGKLCKDKGLIPTGGTDFHGQRRDIDLGNITVGSNIIELLLKKKGELYV